MHRESSATRDSDSRCLTNEVLAAVADARGCRVEDLDARLYDVVDPDCLERLFRTRADGTPRDGEVRVVFTMAGCEVVVESDGTVDAAYHPGTDAKSTLVAATED